MYKSVKKKLIEKWQVPQSHHHHWQQWKRSTLVDEYLIRHGFNSHNDRRTIVKDLEGKLGRAQSPYKIRGNWLISLLIGFFLLLIAQEPIVSVIKANIVNFMSLTLMIAGMLIIIAPAINEIISRERRQYENLIETIINLDYQKRGSDV